MRDKTTYKKTRPGLMARIWHGVLLTEPKHATPPPSSDGWLTLASSGRAVQVIDARDDPLTSLLVTEDACWLFAVEDWRRRQPHRWQRAARRAWSSEAAALVAKRDRLTALTAQLPSRKPSDKPARTPKLPG